MRLAEFGDLTEAEQAVIDGLGTGHVTKLGDGVPAPEAGDDRRVRASLIRWLALGAPGAELRMQEKGVRIAGALIVSDGPTDPVLGEQSTPGLDLEGCRLDHDIVLGNCRFANAPVLRGARVQTLNLQGSHLAGLRADGLESHGDVFLRRAHSIDEVRLLGARIGGELYCDEGRCESAGGFALSADRLETNGGVFLRRVHATGEVRLACARIDGDLDVSGGSFQNELGVALSADRSEIKGSVYISNVTAKGEVLFAGARIGEDFVLSRAVLMSGSSDRALDTAGITVARKFSLFGTRIEGILDLSDAKIERFADEMASWPDKGSLIFNGALVGSYEGTATGAKARLKWLKLQSPEKYGDDYWPQPYHELEDYYRKERQNSEADYVAIDREWVARNSRRKRLPVIMRPLLCAFDRLHYYINGFGFIPILSLLWLLPIVFFGGVLYSTSWNAGAFKPTSDIILRSPEWILCSVEAPRGRYLTSFNEIRRGRAQKGESQLACYLDEAEGRSYPQFNASVYSIDAVLPGSVLSLQDSWMPDHTKGFSGWVSRWFLWLQIIAGWVLSFFALEWATGLKRRKG